jgi:hypothetical protein
MFRPDVRELAGLFPGTAIRRGAIVDGGTFASYVLARVWGHPGAFVKTLLRRSSRVNGAESLASTRYLIPWTFRRFRETCLVLQKEVEVG